MDTKSLTAGSIVTVLVKFGMVRSRTEDGVVTRVTESRVYVHSGGRDRVFVRSTGVGYGDNKHCQLVGEGGN